MRLLYGGGKDARHFHIEWCKDKTHKHDSFMELPYGIHECITPWKFSHTKKTIWAYCEEYNIKFILDQDN